MILVYAVLPFATRGPLGYTDEGQHATSRPPKPQVPLLQSWYCKMSYCTCNSMDYRKINVYNKSKL